MALHFDWTNAPQSKDLDPAEREALVWLTMATDIGDVTGRDADEFAARVQVYERLKGAMLHFDGEPRPFTPERIALGYGLRTNVAFVTRERWLARIVESDMDDMARKHVTLRPATEDKPEPTVQLRVDKVVRHLYDLLKGATRDAGQRDLLDYLDEHDDDLFDAAERVTGRLNAVLRRAATEYGEDAEVERQEAAIGA